MSCLCNEWSADDKKTLLSFKENVDSDDVRIKEKIKDVLLDNRYLIHVLNNKELEEADAEADDYFNVNIKPYFIIPDTQSSTKNFLCYEIGFDETNRYNETVKVLQVTFYILCHQKDIIDADTGIARHDLLAALVQDQFNYIDIFGGKLKIVSDKPSTTATNYAARTLVFETTTDNNLVKTVNGKPYLSNKINYNRYGNGFIKQ